MSSNENIAQKQKKNARKQRGASLVEYALLVSLIAVVSIGALTALQGNIATAFANIGAALTN